MKDVDPSKGRFRSFLLAALRHYLSHERDRAGAQKRGGGTTTLSLDAAAAEDRYMLEATETATPEDVFERRWAMTVLDRSLERLATESTVGDKGPQFDLLKQYLTGVEPQMPYREAADALGMSEGAIRSAVHRMRKRFGECLREEIAETVADPADTNAEVRHLLATVRV